MTIKIPIVASHMVLAKYLHGMHKRDKLPSECSFMLKNTFDEKGKHTHVGECPVECLATCRHRLLCGITYCEKRGKP